MPAPATKIDFLTMVRKSGLLAPERLEKYLRDRQEDLPADSSEAATSLIRDGMLTRFQAHQILKGRYKNFLVGRYKIQEPLGIGGMSRVYLCEHAVMGHRVAMKLLPVQKGADASLVERFFREARAVAAVNHPNIVRAHDVAEEPGKFFYLIMDYVDGVNLHDLVHYRGPLSADRAAHYVAQAADGLQHIHEVGLVHRDVKPGNLLLDRSGTLKILDLGLARFNAQESAGSITARFDDKAILGTADFLSPEQAIQSSNVDIRSDIYSLGATLYYLLAGRPPFVCDNVTQKLLAHQMKQPDSLKKLRPELPDGLVAVVERMLAKNPEDRFQLPADVVEALAPWTSLPIEPPADAEIPQRGLSSTGSASQISGRMPRTGSGAFRRPQSSNSALSGGLGNAGSMSHTPGPGGMLHHSAIFANKHRKRLYFSAGLGIALFAITMWILIR